GDWLITGTFVAGTGDDVVVIDGTEGIWGGDADPADADFWLRIGGASHVANWIIATNTLTGGDAVLDSAGVLTLGTGNDVVVVSAAHATYRAWVGHADPASATWSVTKAGAMHAESGDIGAWEIYDSLITSRSGGTGAGITMDHDESQVGIYDA